MYSSKLPSHNSGNTPLRYSTSAILHKPLLLPSHLVHSLTVLTPVNDSPNEPSRQLHTSLTSSKPTSLLSFLSESKQTSQIATHFNRKLRETAALAKEIRAITQLLESNHSDDSPDLKKSALNLRERVLKSTFYAAFFDEAIQQTDLEYQLDFDNNCMFQFEKVPFELWKEFERQIKQQDKKFDNIGQFGFKQEARYDMISNCKVPTPIAEQSSDDAGKCLISPCKFWR